MIPSECVRDVRITRAADHRQRVAVERVRNKRRTGGCARRRLPPNDDRWTATSFAGGVSHPAAHADDVIDAASSVAAGPTAADSAAANAIRSGKSSVINHHCN